MSKCCTPLIAGISILGASYMVGYSFAGYKKPKTEVKVEIETKPTAKPEAEVKSEIKVVSRNGNIETLQSDRFSYNLQPNPNYMPPQSNRFSYNLQPNPNYIEPQFQQPVNVLDEMPDFYNPQTIGGVDLSFNMIWNNVPNLITATTVAFSTAVGYLYIYRPAYDAVVMLGRLRDTILRTGQQTTNINQLAGQINEIQNNIRLTAEAQRQRINQQYNIDIQSPEEEILNQVQKIKESIDLQPKYGEEFKRLKEQLDDMLNNDKAELDDINKIKKQLEDLKNKDIGQLKDTMDKINLNIDNLQKNIKKEEKEIITGKYIDQEGNIATFRSISELEANNPNNINNEKVVKDLNNTIGVILDENIIQKPKTIEQLRLEMREVYLKKDEDLYNALKVIQKANKEKGITEEITADEQREAYIRIVRYLLLNKNETNKSNQTLGEIFLIYYKNNPEVLNLVKDILKIESYDNIPNKLLEQYAIIVMKYLYLVDFGKNTKGEYKKLFYRAGQDKSIITSTVKRPGFDKENPSKRTEQIVYRGTNYAGVLNAYARDYYLNRDNPIQLIQLFISLQNLLLLMAGKYKVDLNSYIIEPEQFNNISINTLHQMFKKLYDYINNYMARDKAIPIIISDY